MACRIQIDKGLKITVLCPKKCPYYKACFVVRNCEEIKHLYIYSAQAVCVTPILLVLHVHSYPSIGLKVNGKQ